MAQGKPHQRQGEDASRQRESENMCSQEAPQSKVQRSLLIKVNDDPSHREGIDGERRKVGTK